MANRKAISTHLQGLGRETHCLISFSFYVLRVCMDLLQKQQLKETLGASLFADKALN